LVPACECSDMMEGSGVGVFGYLDSLFLLGARANCWSSVSACRPSKLWHYLQGIECPF